MTHLESINSTYEVIEYYISLENDVIVKEVYRDRGRSQRYYYSISEFIRDKSASKRVRDKVMRAILDN